MRLIKVTPRQRQIVEELIRDGADNETIARRVGLSIETVRSHLCAIYRKTGATGRTELAVMVLRGDIVLKTCALSGVTELVA